MSLQILGWVRRANREARERELFDDDPFEPKTREGIPIEAWRVARAKHKALLDQTGHG